MAIVTKEYRCYDCEKDFEVTIDHKKKCRKCIYCQSKNIEGLISLPAISKMADPRTVGTMIEKNNKKNPLSREKSVGSESDSSVKWKNHIQKIKNMTPDQKQRYIEKGNM